MLSGFRIGKSYRIKSVDEILKEFGTNIIRDGEDLVFNDKNFDDLVGTKFKSSYFKNVGSTITVTEVNYIDYYRVISNINNPFVYPWMCEMVEDKPSMVDHPSHYNMGSIEAIDVIEDWKLNFNLGSVVKYICRCGFKDNEIQELEKAKWYIQREIERRTK